MITGMAFLRNIWKEIRKASEQLFQGEITISKRECWMIGAILLLSGIAIGLINAPLTHGVSISLASNNGSNNGNNSANNNTQDVEALDKLPIRSNLKKDKINRDKIKKDKINKK